MPPLRIQLRRCLALVTLVWLLSHSGPVLAGSNVLAWGYGWYGQTDVPAGLTNAVAVAGGLFQSLALRVDGRVVAWGENRYGETDVPGGLTNAVSIGAGDNFCVAARANGQVVAWSSNTWGVLTLPNGLSNAVAVAAAYAHSVALRADGTVVVWGPNTWGETNVPADLTNVVAIACGASHILALRADGTVAAWGGNYASQATVPLWLTNAVAIAAGGTLSLALRVDGTVVTWGQNPPLPESLTNVVGIAAGDQTALALLADGRVIAWGFNYPAATAVPGLSNAVAIAGGRGHTLAVVGSGPPFLTAPLVNRATLEGGTVYFRMAASGAWPLSYQWQFNGTNLPGANSGVLALTNVQQAQSGTYSVTVSNAFGVVTSGGALLTVISRESRILVDSLTRTNRHFQFTARTSPVGSTWSVEASTNLINWRYMTTLSSDTGTVTFTDPSTIFSRRFYRLRLRQ